MNQKAIEREKELWRLFVREGLDYEGDTNCKLPFAVMSKRYGKAFIEYLKAAWSAKADMPEEEFCRLNGDVPAQFVEKNLR